MVGFILGLLTGIIITAGLLIIPLLSNASIVAKQNDIIRELEKSCRIYEHTRIN